MNWDSLRACSDIEVVELTPEEAASTAALADAQPHFSERGDPDLYVEYDIASRNLCPRIQRACARWAQALPVSTVFRGFDLGTPEPNPPGPVDRPIVPQRATVTGALILLRAGHTPIGQHDMQKGRVGVAVYPHVGREGTQSNAGTVANDHHGDWGWAPEGARANAVALGITRSEPERDAAHRVVPARRLLPRLSWATEQVLRAPRFLYRPTAGFGAHAPECQLVAPVVTGPSYDPEIRYDTDMQPLDTAAAAAIRLLREAIEAESIDIPPEKGQLILHHNLRVLHGRRAVAGGPHPMARQAFRIWGVRDPRQLSLYQPYAGAPVDPCEVLLDPKRSVCPVANAEAKQ
jgi:hypothetical protein